MTTIPHEEGASGAGSSTEAEIMSASLEQGALGPESGPSETVVILYTNWRGETAVRRITPIAREWFGSSDWHPEPQWLFTAFDMDKEAFRDFARSGIKAWGQAAVDAALSASAPASGAERMTAGAVEIARAAHHAHCLELAARVLRSHQVPSTATSCDDAAAYLRALIAATPAPAATPGVPDSVRALIEKLVAMSTAWGIFSDERGFASGLMLEAANILATHPAGQSAGSGAEADLAALAEAASVPERAYGILWRLTAFDTGQIGYAHDARKVLLAAMDKESQRRGIAWATRQYGPLGPNPRFMLSDEDRMEMGL